MRRRTQSRLRTVLVTAIVCVATAVMTGAVPVAGAAPTAGIAQPERAQGGCARSPGVQTGDSPETGDARPSQWKVRLLGERTIPKGLALDGMPVGELSGIDYDEKDELWYIVSDDSEEAPARFFTADIALNAEGLERVRFTNATAIQRSDGTPFPPLASADAEVADPESIRLDPRTRTFYWSSEGKREAPTEGAPLALADPWVRQMTLSGRHLREFDQPPAFAMSTKETGPRHNAVFEGLALSADGRELITSLEGPLFDDGPAPTPSAGGISRLTWYDKRSGAPVRQHAYDLDPIPAVPDPPTAGADNGVTELLPIDRDRLLVLERAFISGVGNSIRIYEIDVDGATDTLSKPSLADADVQPVRKRLVVDLAKLDLDHIDNVEGMTWGPRLPSGERTLVLVSDDNFNPPQVNQVIALALR